MNENLNTQADIPSLRSTQNTVAPTATLRLFVDMDGTLAEFRAVDTLETLYQPNYFANLAPNKNVVGAVRAILKDHPEIEVFILSAVLSDSAHAQIEKNQWLDEQLPEIASSHRIFMPCGQDKKAYIPGGVQPTDYLLDDYTHNLTLWEPPARGIKLMNGINGTHGTWQGYRVDYLLESHALANAMLGLIRGQKAAQEVKPLAEPMTAAVHAPAALRDRGGNGQVIQAIKEHFDILRYAEEQYGLHFKESSRGWMQCVEYDSMYIDPVAQTFVRHSRGISGDVVNMVAHFDNLSLNDAISKLRQEIGAGLTPYKRNDYDTLRQKQETIKSFELPKKLEGKYSKLFGYLVNRRCIEPKVVSDMVKGKLLYESAEHHNCVFVGMDYDGKAKSATLRSTGDIKFQGEVPGSEKLGWIVNPNKAIMFIGEAPIDMLSVMSLLERGGKDYNNFTFLAQGGNPRPGMLAHHMQNNPKVTMVYLCHDNDDAGQALADKALLELQNCGFSGDVKRKLPTGKDFNDDLKQLLCAKAPAQEQAAETQQEVTPCFSQE